MTGHYPSTDFEIVDEGNIRKVRHLPAVMLIETGRLRGTLVPPKARPLEMRHGATVQ